MSDRVLFSGARLRSVCTGLAAVLLLSSCLSSCRVKRSSPGGTTGIPLIALTPFAEGFTQPLQVAHAGDGSGRVFVVEQGGLIKIVKNGVVLATPFLDVSSLLKSANGEQGLLGLAFSPGYGSGKGTFYINYTSAQGVGDTVVARYRVSSQPDIADPASAETLLTVVQPFANHNGGKLAFGPDGRLYIGMGDGGSGGDPFNNAQNVQTLLGKLLRIDVETQPGAYTIPADNPFVGNAAARPEIWALGLRNPWRFSFDRSTGDLYIADVGQNSFEEVNMTPAASTGGENYGWNIMEGFHCFNAAACDQQGLTPPVAEYSHGAGDCSVTGGFVYRGSEFPALQGTYLYGDYCSGRIWGAKRSEGVWTTGLMLDSGLLISAFGEDEAGGLFVVDHGGGGIYKIVLPAAGGGQ